EAWEQAGPALAAAEQEIQNEATAGRKDDRKYDDEENTAVGTDIAGASRRHRPAHEGGAGGTTSLGCGGGIGIFCAGRTRPCLQSMQMRGRSFRNLPPLRQA